MLDSSATLAWIYGEETTAAIHRLFDAIAENGAVVPALWWLEVANSLTVAVRRGRIDAPCRIEVAQRRALPLATLDAPLRAAGTALGISLLGADA